MRREDAHRTWTIQPKEVGRGHGYKDKEWLVSQVENQETVSQGSKRITSGRQWWAILTGTAKSSDRGLWLYVVTMCTEEAKRRLVRKESYGEETNYENRLNCQK